jgi:transcription initiation factor TFIIIB Brf1 subunit/transcription initiation factor TFIIB
MSKIIKDPTFEQVTCRTCGCIYEYEQGDKIYAEHRHFSTKETDTTVFCASIICPVCGDYNALKKKEA